MTDLFETKIGYIRSTDIDAFKFIVLSVSSINKEGLYEYKCQEYCMRQLQSELYLVCDGSMNYYNIIKTCLEFCKLPLNGLQPIEYYTRDEKKPLEKAFPFIFDGNKAYEIIWGIFYNAGLSVKMDIVMGVPYFNKVDNWYTDYAFLDPVTKEWSSIDGYKVEDMLITQDLSFDSTNIVTSVTIRPATDARTEGQYSTSLELLEVDLEKYFGKHSTVVGSTRKPSTNDDDDDNTLGTIPGGVGPFDSNGVSADKTKICGIGRSTAYNPYNLPYAWYKCIFKNHCPMCGANGYLKIHGIVDHFPYKDDYGDTEITCTAPNCGADFSSPDGAEKSGEKRPDWMLTALTQRANSSLEEYKSMKNGNSNTNTSTQSTQVSTQSTEVTSQQNSQRLVADSSTQLGDNSADDDNFYHFMDPKAALDRTSSVSDIIASNQLAARYAISDSLSEAYNQKITIPAGLRNFHTGRFLYIQIPKDYVLKNLDEIYSKIAKYLTDVPYRNSYIPNFFYIKSISTNITTQEFTSEIELSILATSVSPFYKIVDDAFKKWKEAAKSAEGDEALTGGVGKLEDLRKSDIKGRAGLTTICNFVHNNFHHCGLPCDDDVSCTSGFCVGQKYLNGVKNCSDNTKVCVNCQGISKYIQAAVFAGHPNYDAICVYGGGDKHMNLKVTIKEEKDSNGNVTTEGETVCFNVSDCCTGNGHSGGGQIGDCYIGYYWPSGSGESHDC
jgi:hypothetical protein